MSQGEYRVAVLLEVKKDVFSGGLKPYPDEQLILVVNAQMLQDLEFSNIKRIQTKMFLSELMSIWESTSVMCEPGTAPDPSATSSHWPTQAWLGKDCERRVLAAGQKSPLSGTIDKTNVK
uniref:Uncharacterized protein n=1 Tax=Knipowitschia caucasica TaxID=637954 RepID=A0AAV2LPC7_KNICA